jgi:D-alanyl-D-alanine dipeptidase
VDCFLLWATQPEDGRTKQRHYPNIDRADMLDRGYVAARSGHTRGSAIDLTIYHVGSGELAPMGGRHDLMDPISAHSATALAPIEAENRAHLRSVMEACGFVAYDSEWWHYTLNSEPHPDEYFDFPIN